ncbi:zinc metalloproteinase nas-4-like [Photinus pyralis]|uniref:zinc metalloproteinase nas-4-like n=1 Tax=Photinus pyralis TaxID=7054 RepID=UPI0012670FA9|nr:zinc metalloproteinase nas-4-like [Photinus pyralis]
MLVKQNILSIKAWSNICKDQSVVLKMKGVAGFILCILVHMQIDFCSAGTTEAPVEEVCATPFYRLAKDIRRPRKRNGLVDTEYRWKNATICYIITGTFTEEEQKTIRTSLATGFVGTCLRAIECKDCCGGDYVFIKNDEPGCLSPVGRVDGPQELNLGEGCTEKGTILHETLHAAGFTHEQNNPNRDDYVIVLEENVIPDELVNFEKFSPDYVTSFGAPYDVCSIMHYDECSFSVNGKKTLLPKEPPNCTMGFINELSPIDRLKVNLMYNCTDYLLDCD